MSRCVHWLLAAVLLATAASKAYEFTRSGLPETGWFADPNLRLLTIEWEIVLAAWLVSGLARPVACWPLWSRSPSSRL